MRQTEDTAVIYEAATGERREIVYRDGVPVGLVWCHGDRRWIAWSWRTGAHNIHASEEAARESV